MLVAANKIKLNQPLKVDDCYHLLDMNAVDILENASGLRNEGYNRLISYSRKVFIPLTQLCRDVCHYCTFTKAPKRIKSPYLTPTQVLDIAKAGKSAGCKEALFTLGDKPELRYSAAREALENLGYETTLSYLAAMAKLVFEETGLLPHLNPGIMDASEITLLRSTSVSMGIMLESVSQRLLERGECHFGSPDKEPGVRLSTIEEAGRQNVPFTTGILIGIGETRRERIDSLLALRDLHSKYGHLQEIIIQNFRAKPDTKMALAEEPDLGDLQWTVAVARLVFGPKMSIQAPPNLTQGGVAGLIEAGANDLGGISPVTPDYVNPEAPWPHLDELAVNVAGCDKLLVERLAVYPEYLHDRQRWIDKGFHRSLLELVDSDGLARTDDWAPGEVAVSLPEIVVLRGIEPSRKIDKILSKAVQEQPISETDVTTMFEARSGDVLQITSAADEVRQKVCGDSVSYVVTRNINYTNICYFKCRFCAFSKGKTAENLRGKPYNLKLEEIVGKAQEAWDRGAVEVCLQGGIHPDYTGQTYLDILTAIKKELPELHIHAFSPLEISQGAKTLGLPLEAFLERLIDAGLGSLPGTAAEILDDEVRAVLCLDKINTAEWFEVVDTAHRLGLKTTATIMFGHIDRPIHWARHLLLVRAQQEKYAGFTELVPLPFVHMESPIYLKGGARRGPTWRESLLMHAVSRLVLHPSITNIQASWVKLGPVGVARCLEAGANDLGGTLMNETITRSAGASHGQEMTPKEMESLLTNMGRPSRQRTTLYGDATPFQQFTSYIEAAE